MPSLEIESFENFTRRKRKIWHISFLIEMISKQKTKQNPLFFMELLSCMGVITIPLQYYKCIRGRDSYRIEASLVI